MLSLGCGGFLPPAAHSPASPSPTGVQAGTDALSGAPVVIPSDRHGPDPPCQHLQSFCVCVQGQHRASFGVEAPFLMPLRHGGTCPPAVPALLCPTAQELNYPQDTKVIFLPRLLLPP